MRDTTSPILLWIRRDLRINDHPALSAACASGRPIIPVFIRDETIDALGAAAKWRFGLGLEAFDRKLRSKGSQLVLRRGNALKQLKELIEETGAGSVCWIRAYDPESRSRDTAIKSALKADGIDARSFGGHLLFEPWTVATKTGGFYRVYSPFWRAVRDRVLDHPLPPPLNIPAPGRFPVSDQLSSWGLDRGMRRGALVVQAYVRPGENAALAKLAQFVDEKVDPYKTARDVPAADATSGMSEYLTYGEIGPNQLWHAGLQAMQDGKRGAEHFLKELVWREFAYHLMYHSPEILSRNWRPEWDHFPWRTDDNAPEVLAWKQGCTGISFVDAAMREMYVTGRMHNRARMIVASYLTKHLMTHWKIGMNWFADCLIDWDPASNAMGWQWVAGSGPDAAPYFRIFNPDGQLDKFDRDRRYVNRWIAEGQTEPPQTSLDYFRAIPKSWQMTKTDAYPEPIVGLAEGRQLALNAYENRTNVGV